uniref:Uncharacterized protein n=1 Tax=Panagrolaimus superbus TaxID=310955 RepID=A0A914Z5T9_9BILA
MDVAGVTRQVKEYKDLQLMAYAEETMWRTHHDEKCFTETKTCSKCGGYTAAKNGTRKRPLASIIYDETEQEFLSAEPQNVCDGFRNLNDIRGLEARRTELARVRENRDKPRVAAINLANQLTRRFGARPKESCCK